MKKQHYMTRDERLQLEALRRAKVPVIQIARQMGFCRQTIYNELRRGAYQHNVDYAYVTRYSADKAHGVHLLRQQNKGRELKLGHDRAYADFLERKILRDRYSPAAALAAARAEGFETCVCVATLYSYINKGVFYELSNAHLWEKPRRRKKSPGEVSRIVHAKLPSIEERPGYINERSEPGHWEMDLVVGPQESRSVLLTLTERVTRYEIIRKLPDRKAATIRKAIDQIERKTPNFKRIFKSISTDNGPEFLEYDKLVRSVRGGKRFEVYYCHSYAAWEKGTNENHNRMIRRFFPKGTDFAKVTHRQIAELQDWMNGYPRKRLGWRSPSELTA